jgi:hypothetical protein
LLTSIGIIKEKIYARKCVLKKVNLKEERLFLEGNHLQGYNSSTVCYGLYYNGELVQLMSFIKKKDHWEIQRLCTKINTIVIGGAEKLWNYFLEDNKPDFVITYSDRDYFTGKVYEKLGMRLEKVTNDRFWYTDGFKKISRYKLQKHKVLKNSNDNLQEVLIKKNIYKIYGSGLLKYVWNKNNV